MAAILYWFCYCWVYLTDLNCFRYLDGLDICRIGNFSARKVQEEFQVKDIYKGLLVVALGYPCETVVLEDTEGDKNSKYCRYFAQVDHVPKRPLDDILISCPL